MKKYNITQSPLYKLSNKKKLAKILCISFDNLKEMQRNRTPNKDLENNNDKNYKIKNIKDKKGKERIIEVPNEFLKKIHKIITKLLSNIETPAYLHSAIKERSYKTNAEAHIGIKTTYKTDILNFFPSTSFYHIFLLFKETFLCDLDIATILSKICTFQNHLPTGSPLSPILSFFANKKMFDEIYDLSLKNNIIFTLYVDDLTFSGKGVFKFSREIENIVKKYNHKIKRRKNVKYLAGKTKEITGVIVKNDQLLLPNKRYKKIREKENYILNLKDKIPIADLRELGGRLREAVQFDKRLRNKFSNINKKISLINKKEKIKK